MKGSPVRFRASALHKEPRLQRVSSGCVSLIYSNASVYQLVMRGLYGRHHRERLRAVAEQVPAGASVLELCCGPGSLYLRHLRARVGSYVGLDANPGFVAGLQARGVDARLIDLIDGTQLLPRADVAIMQASLYHFLPDADAIVQRMLGVAERCVIISEPVRNLSSSTLPLIGTIARRATDPGVGDPADRFTETTLDQLMAAYDVRAAFLAPGGRDKVYVLGASG
jgi:SAM-dependent methyltransferase